MEANWRARPLTLKKRQTDRHESGDIVGGVIRMAEGRGQLILGRVPPRQPITNRNLK